MKISIVAPGKMSIPPKSWGAVEILIWDYKTWLEKLGHEIQIVNQEDLKSIADQVNSFGPDFVHIQYDEYYDALDLIRCPNKAITSHYGYLEGYSEYQKLFRSGLLRSFLGQKVIRKFFVWNPKLKALLSYWPIFKKFISGPHQIFALSEGIKATYAEFGVNPDRISVIPNGAREDLFKFEQRALYADRSLYLAKIDYRKRQWYYQSLKTLYFVGQNADKRFNTDNPRYLGSWTKDFLYEHLTDYANLVLLSDGEAHPLVCCEALMAGLGLVVSEYAAANLNTQLPFITVIPKSRLGDRAFVEQKIAENRRRSITMREDIRRYGVENFSWAKLVGRYQDLVKNQISAE